MTHIGKMRNKLLYMEDFLLNNVGISKEDQYLHLYEWAEQWGEEKIICNEAITQMLVNKAFWGWWKMQVYQIQFMFSQMIFVDKKGDTYLNTVSKYSKVNRKVYETKKIKSIYLQYMSEMVLGKKYNSPVGDLAHHNFVKTISI